MLGLGTAPIGKAAQQGEVMARWRVDYLGKKGSHLGSVEAADEKSAIAEAARQFNITPARRNKIVVTRTQASVPDRSD